MEHYSGLADCLGRIETSSSMQALWSSVKDFAGRLGYSHVLAVDAGRLSGGARGAAIYSDASRQVLEALDQEMEYAQHPVVQRALLTDIPFFLSDMRDQAERAGQRWPHFLADVVKRGEGLVVPVYRDSKPVAGFNFGGEAPDTSANARSMLQVVAHAAIQRHHMIGNGRTERPSPDSPPALSTREAQCLRLVAVGKTDAEVGQMLGISPRTVRFHVDSSKAKLGVTTRIQAVAKALRDKVIAV
jgi:DNA-binding CsgD family transcriptional regulator